MGGTCDRESEDDVDDLTRFKSAQVDGDAGFMVAIDELRGGRKRSHWIWYVFPQLAGLGSSSMSRHFGIQGRREAEAYLQDDELRRRLIDAVDVVAAHLRRANRPHLHELMGSRIDALKLVSSLTLFEAVAGDLSGREPSAEIAHVAEQAGAILAAAASQGYDRCEFTLRHLDAP